ncbi:MAG: hypothetical protein QG597_5225 [Actinomycetota bacterium]|nr:hypothetical protein [Actinomycetota bacterium]
MLSNGAAQASPVLIAAVLVLSACGNGSERVGDTQSSPLEQSPSPANTTPKPPAASTAKRVAPATSFDLAMVRWTEVVKKNKGGQANVHIVGGVTDYPTLKRLGLECVEHFLGEQKAAYCHVWGTDADYEARDPQNAGDTLCWTHYIGVPLMGGDPSVMAGELFTLKIERCPNAAAYTK